MPLSFATQQSNLQDTTSADALQSAGGASLLQPAGSMSALGASMGAAGPLGGMGGLGARGLQQAWGNSFLQAQLTSSGQVSPPPPVNIAQYAWLVQIYVRSGALTQPLAEALVRAATPQQLQALQNLPPSTHTAPAEPAVPSAELESDDNNRARPLDWSANPAQGHMSPETPTGTQAGQVGRQSLNTTFTEHQRLLVIEEFGAGATLLQVRQAISLAETLGRNEVVAHLRARLGRVNQYAAVETLNVEDSGRYAAGGGNTYCNIYAYDLVTALGAYVPRVWWYDATIRRIQAGTPAVTVEEYNRRAAAGENVRNLIRPVYGETVREMNANSINAWFRTYGASFGWREAADMTAAQQAANEGKIVVMSAANRNAAASGHINVVLAEKGTHTAHRHADGTVEAPLQSQAGAENFKYDNNSAGLNRQQWWENANHVNGGAWINDGGGRSPILTPEELGL